MTRDRYLALVSICLLLITSGTMEVFNRRPPSEVDRVVKASQVVAEPLPTPTLAPLPPPPPTPTPVRAVTASVKTSSRVPSDLAFWKRLSNCESPTGVVGRHVGYFQFSWDTARKVGIDGSESYEEQRAAAMHWASLVNPGSRAGWPVCWHVALRGG